MAATERCWSSFCFETRCTAVKAGRLGTGKVEAFWMPQIKNLAVVVFETAEQAEAARQATSGRSWPDNGVRNSLRPRCSARHQSLGFLSCMCPSILASRVGGTSS